MIIPVILSGGTGTRLWPVSREAHPKPFIQLADGQTLLQKTFLRAQALPNVQEILTITNREYYYQTKEAYDKMPSTETPVVSFLLEPCARNTAPAVLIAALKIAEKYGDNAMMLVLPADHVICNLSAFATALEHALPLARQHKLVTFGVTPTEPDTAFGYIECDEDHGVKRFVEKPNKTAAEAYLCAGNYLWNAGIFCFTAGTLLAECRMHAPDLLQAVTNCWRASQHPAWNYSAAMELDKPTFTALDNISLDYALLEKSAAIAVVRATFDWNDVGSWDRIMKLYPPDAEGNVTMSDTLLLDSQDNFIYSENRLIAAIGMHNLVIVDTPDALLIADKNQTQRVKEIVGQLKVRAHETVKSHRTMHRPWGAYTVLEEGPQFKIKRIVVKPGAALSLQLHQFRSEHWVVVSGTAKVTNGEKENFLAINESTFIAAGHKHRLENPGAEDLIIIEVQTGTYLGEDDIVRFDDDYGRHQEGTAA